MEIHNCAVCAAFLSKLVLGIGETVITRRDFDKGIAAHLVVHVGKDRPQFFSPLAVLARPIFILIHHAPCGSLCHI